MKQLRTDENGRSNLDVLVLALKDLVEEHEKSSARDIAIEIDNTIDGWNLGDREVPVEKESGVRRNGHKMRDVLDAFGKLYR